MNQAFLVAYVDTQTLKVVGAAIHSEPARSLTVTDGSEFALDVYSYYGTSFDDAQRKLRAAIAHERSFRWILPLLPERP